MLLRPLTEADRAEYVRVDELNEQFWRAWAPAPVPGETDSAVRRFERALRRQEEELAAGTGLRLTGFLPDGRLAVIVTLTQIFRGPFQNAYMGWRANLEVAGQGYASEAGAALLDLAFAPEPEGLCLHRVQANVMPHNDASIRLAEKLGFRREGLARRYLKIAGEWQDHVMLAKLAEEHQPCAGPDVASSAMGKRDDH